MPLLCITILWNTVVYAGSRLITHNWPHYNLETQLDLVIPFIPWTVSIYLGCYLLWAGSYLFLALQNKTIAYRFFSADFLARFICLLCFLLLPTTNTRPDFIANSFWEQVMFLLYQIDAADNLFPSIHCLTSWFCYIGLSACDTVPSWCRRIVFWAAIAVFISTLTTKQHILFDVAGGFLLAEFCFYITKQTAFADYYTRVLDSFLRKYHQVFNR